MALKSAAVILILGIVIGYFIDFEPHIQFVRNSASKLFKTILSDTNPRKPSTSSSKDSKNEASDRTVPLFTKDELWKYYRGEEGSKGLHIAIMGRVYDVKKGKKHYGPNGGYSFFAGRDGTKAYATGEFNDEGLTDDLTGVQVSHFGEYENWVEFFDKEYTYVGNLIGKFYDENGQPTADLEHAHKMMKESEKLKEKDAEHRKKFPQCNSEWTQAKGSRVWCTKKSGGIDRDWVGVPRLLKPVGQNVAYCVCIRNTGPPMLGHTTEDKNNGDLDYPYLKEYDGCDPKSVSCKVKLRD